MELTTFVPIESQSHYHKETIRIGIAHSGGLESGSLESGGLESGSLESGGLQNSGNGFWMWICTCLSRSPESGGLESGSLESGGLESRATDFGSDSAHACPLETI